MPDMAMWHNQIMRKWRDQGTMTDDVNLFSGFLLQSFICLFWLYLTTLNCLYVTFPKRNKENACQLGEWVLYRTYLTTLTPQLLFSLSPQTNSTPWSLGLLNPMFPTLLISYFATPRKLSAKYDSLLIDMLLCQYFKSCFPMYACLYTRLKSLRRRLHVPFLWDSCVPLSRWRLLLLGHLAPFANCWPVKAHPPGDFHSPGVGLQASVLILPPFSPLFKVLKCTK